MRAYTKAVLPFDSAAATVRGNAPESPVNGRQPVAGQPDLKHAIQTEEKC